MNKLLLLFLFNLFFSCSVKTVQRLDQIDDVIPVLVESWKSKNVDNLLKRINSKYEKSINSEGDYLVEFPGGLSVFTTSDYKTIQAIHYDIVDDEKGRYEYLKKFFPEKWEEKKIEYKSKHVIKELKEVNIPSADVIFHYDQLDPDREVRWLRWRKKG